MIVISSPTFDLDGSVAINPIPGADIGETRRRVSRAATLDGGVAISDKGFSEGDRTLIYAWKSVSKDHNALVERIVRLYPRVYVSTEFGVYEAAPQVFEPSPSECTLTLLAIEKVSA